MAETKETPGTPATAAKNVPSSSAPASVAQVRESAPPHPAKATQARTRNGMGYVFTAVASKDRPTRRMAWVFWLSLSGLLAIIASGFLYYRTFRPPKNELEEEDSSKQLSSFLKKTADDAKRKGGGLDLGAFQIELKPIAGGHPASRGLDVAEIEIFVQTDTASTRAFLETHSPQVRNEILTVFVSVERDTLMSKEGKEKLKKAATERLNAWLPEGKIEEMYFTRLVVN